MIVQSGTEYQLRYWLFFNHNIRNPALVLLLEFKLVSRNLYVTIHLAKPRHGTPELKSKGYRLELSIDLQ